MIEVQMRTYNPFQENTYLLINAKKECIIIDPGCYFAEEQKQFLEIIRDEQLVPVRLINTHAHLDHIFGNHLVGREYKLGLELHELEQPVLDNSPQAGMIYNIPFEPSPAPSKYLKEGDIIFLGEDTLQVIFTPGHSPGSISLYCAKQHFVIAGDVLFRQSIGRTDLPGGDYATLIKSIKEQLFSLDDDVIVYPGHGPATSIGGEKKHNPFLQE